MSRPLAPFIKVLARSKIVWMQGHEMGLVMEKGEIALWPYMTKGFEELCDVLTHEVVHRVHMKMSEEGVEKVTAHLMQRLQWLLAVREALGEALYEGVKEMQTEKKCELG